jgi:mannose-6-phosphate isomerase-like protein (cupin superfamily)
MNAEAAVVVRAGEGKTVRWGPDGRIRVIADEAATGGAFSIVESTEPPGSAAPLHVHHGEAEGFFILEGTVELTCGGDTVTASAGDFVYTPTDVPHKYVVVGRHPARILLLFSRPGFEQFFLDAGAPLDGPPGRPPDPAVLERYDLEVLEPPAH